MVQHFLGFIEESQVEVDMKRPILIAASNNRFMVAFGLSIVATVAPSEGDLERKRICDVLVISDSVLIGDKTLRIVECGCVSIAAHNAVATI